MRDTERYADAFDRFEVRGKVRDRWVMPAKGYIGFQLAAGRSMRFLDLEGKQVPDVVLYNANDLRDALNMCNSMLLNKRRELVRGNVLYSIDCNPLAAITDYSNEISFSYGSMCSEPLNRLRYGAANTPNCRDNLAKALEPWGMGTRDIPDAFVPFMNVIVNDDGSMAIEEPTSTPGDFYDLRAEMDLVVGVSNCPQERNACNGFNPTPIGMVIFDER
jgi:uncharacterized protein YcgI (DUF1989 family)